ncbi:MAG: hypothetical protein MJE68_21665, partial [Proteobacteria bacterium]|nr:hypothetical protein [Pseudomonadota bacterium]
MVAACLPQFLHHKELFNEDLLQKQIALHMLKHANLFYPYVQQDLLDNNESYESYCVNIFYGKVWGDDFILSALGHMFNVAITLISPCFDQQMDLFHEKQVPDIVVIANGGDYVMARKPCTHFSGSHMKPGIKFTIPGSEMKNPNLKPVIFAGYQRGADDSLKHYLREEKDMCLLKLRAVCKDIENFDEKVVKLIKASDDLIEKKSQIEHKLENLGVKTEEIRKAGHVKERSYVRTELQKQRDESDRAAKQIEDELLGVDDDLDDGVEVMNVDERILLDIGEGTRNPTGQLLTDDQYMNIDDESVESQKISQDTAIAQISQNPEMQERVNKVLLETGMNPELLRFLPMNQPGTSQPVPQNPPQFIQPIPQNPPQFIQP